MQQEMGLSFVFVFVIGEMGFSSNQIVSRIVGEMFNDSEIMLFKLLTLKKVFKIKKNFFETERVSVCTSCGEGHRERENPNQVLC